MLGYREVLGLMRFALRGLLSMRVVTELGELMRAVHVMWHKVKVLTGS